MIFYIRHQQVKLRDYTLRVIGRNLDLSKLVSEESRKAIANANYTYKLFALHTKTSLGKFLSFIPGSSLFMLRVNYSRFYNLAMTSLKTEEINIRNRVQGIVTPSSIIPTRHSKSGTVALPRHFNSPIAKPHPNKSHDSVSNLSFNTRFVLKGF